MKHRTVGGFSPDSSFTSIPMTESGAGRLNLFAANAPDYHTFIAERVEYKIEITATRNGETVTRTTPVRTLFLSEPLIQQ